MLLQGWKVCLYSTSFSIFFQIWKRPWKHLCIVFVLRLITLLSPLCPLVVDFDYTTASPLEVTFVSGSALVNSTSCAQISIIDDDAFEGSHSFSVLVSTVEIETDGTDPLLTIGTLSSAAIYIEDNDSTFFLYVVTVKLLW